MTTFPNQIAIANAGRRWQFRFRGSHHAPGVAEFFRWIAHSVQQAMCP